MLQDSNTSSEPQEFSTGTPSAAACSKVENTRAMAVALATRGFRVFRIAKGTKKHFIDSDWATSATCDAWAVWDRFSDPATGESVECNIGILGGGVVVIDVDVPGAHHKKDGRPALEELKAAGLDTNTFTVRTAGGGLHLYYNTAGKVFGNKPLAPGLEVKCYNGYVIGPGSTFGGGTYEIISDAEPIDVPEILAQRLSGVVDRVEGGPAVQGELDTEAGIAGAREYLSKQEPAVEGEGGDNHTYRVCCGVLDFGLTVDTAMDVMADWDATCSPPWGEDLRRKLENAASHRQNPIGKNNPLNHYDAVDPALLPKPEPAGPTSGASTRPPLADLIRTPRMSFEDIARIPRRRWIAQRDLLRGKITEITAPGSVGKSSLFNQWAVAIALGDGRFCALDVREQVSVVLINLEDDYEDAQRRIGAMALSFGIPLEALEGRLFVFSGLEWGFKVAERRGAGLVVSQQLRELTAFVKRQNIGAVFIDPLVDVHDAKENDNGEMAMVMRTLRAFASETDVALAVAHHTRKPAGASPNGHVGSADAGRGGSAIVNAVRIGKTLSGPTEDDMKALPKGEAHRYVRLDDSKMNLSLKSAEPQWFYKESIPLGNGEMSYVFRPVTLPKPEGADDRRPIALDFIGRREREGVPVPTARKGNKGAAFLLSKECELWSKDEWERTLLDLEAEKAIRRSAKSGTEVWMTAAGATH